MMVSEQSSEWERKALAGMFPFRNVESHRPRVLRWLKRHYSMRGETGGLERPLLLRSGEIGLAMTNLIVASGYLHFDGAIRVGRAARVGIVREPVLCTKLTIDAVENGGKFRGRVWVEHGAAGGIGHGFEGVLAGSVPPVFVFHGTDHNRVQKHIRADGLPASSLEIGAACRFPCIRDEDDNATAVVSAMRERAGAQQHRVVDGSARPVRNFADRSLKGDDVVGKPGRTLRYILIEGKHSQAVTGPHNLADEMSCGFLLKSDFLVSTHARVNHQGQVQRLRSFRLEDGYFLFLAFIEKLKCFARQIRRGAVMVVEDADEHGHQIYVNANAISLDGWLWRLLLGRRRSRRDDVAWCAIMV